MFQLAAVLLALLSGFPSSLEEQAKISIFVGPQMRDGFVDIDSGTLDSIKDIKDEIKKSDVLASVDKPEQAKIVLLVARRHITTGGGGVAVANMVVPFDRRSVETVIRVGDYEKTTVSESEAGGTWRNAAKQVAKDLAVWVEANRARLGK